MKGLLIKLIAQASPNGVDVTREDVGLPGVSADAPALQNILNTAFLLIGAVSVLVIVIEGFKYVVSGGDPEKTKRAKDAILYALAGLVVSLLAVTIVSFVAGEF